MIMGNGPARLFPDLLLRVQLGGSYRIFENFQTRVSGQQRSNGRAVVPGSAVPEQENRCVRERVQDKPQMGSTGTSRQIRTAADQFTPGAQIEGDVKADFGAPRVNTHQGGIAYGRPDAHGCGLQVHPGFILTQNDGLRCVLSHIHQFFSVLAWNSATSRSRRDLYTFSVRW